MERTLIIDEEFKALIPNPQQEEYEQLEQNILSENKCRDPLVIWNDTIIDGHNRFEICTKHGIKDYQVVEKEFESKEAAKLWIIENQLGRRNITDAARISLALEYEGIFKAKGKENQKQSQGRGKKGLSNLSNLNEPAKPVNSRKEVANMADASEGSVGKVKKIKKDGTPELIQEVMDGTKSIDAGYKELKKKSVENQKVVDVEEYEIVEETPPPATDSAQIPLKKNPLYVLEISECCDSILDGYGQDILLTLKTQAESDVQALTNVLEQISSRIEKPVETSEDKPVLVEDKPVSLAELDSPEWREQMLSDNPEEKSLSRICFSKDDKYRLEYYRKLEVYLGLCDDAGNILIISYQTYREFIIEPLNDWSAEKLEKHKIKIQKAKDSAKSA